MATTTLNKPRPSHKTKKLKFWPSIRFVTTIGFLLLIGGNLWNGSTCVLDIGPYTIACPLGVVQLVTASRVIVPGLLLAGLSGYLLIVLFGRAFCGWICPGRWIFNRGPTTNSRPWKYRAWAQRIMVGGVLGAAYVCHNPIFCTICPAGVVCRGAIAAGTGGSILPSVGWMGALLGFEWASGRSFCRDLCPLGAGISRLSRFNPFLKVQSNPDTCQPCIACQRVCPEDLNLSKDEDLSSCTKCMQCLSACPRSGVEIKVFAELP